MPQVYQYDPSADQVCGDSCIQRVYKDLDYPNHRFITIRINETKGTLQSITRTLMKPNRKTGQDAPEEKPFYAYTILHDDHSTEKKSVGDRIKSMTLEAFKAYPFLIDTESMINGLLIRKTENIPFNLGMDAIHDTHMVSVKEIPLYTKQVFKSTTIPYLVYATMDGSSFVCLEFHEKSKEETIKAIHICKGKEYGNSGGSCGSYDTIFSIQASIYGKKAFTKPFFNDLYAFSIDVYPNDMLIRITNLRRNLSVVQPAECEIKRLIQRRGFCYYHAVLHALLIPEAMKRLCCQKLLEYMDALKSNTLPSYTLESFINIDICENFAAEYNDSNPPTADKLIQSTRYYVMKFFYQYLFHYETLQQRIHASFEDTEKIHPVDVLALHEKKDYTGSVVSVPDGGDDNAVIKELVQKVLNYNIEYATGADKPDAFYDIFIETISSTYYDKDRHILHPMVYNKITHPLSFGLITIQYDDSTETPIKRKGHAMFGFICGTKKYLLDSRRSTNPFYECDWTTIDTLIAHPFIQQQFFSSIQTNQKTTVYGYYVKTTTPTMQDSCQTIRINYLQSRMIDTLQASNLDPRIKETLAPLFQKEKIRRTRTALRMLPSIRPIPTSGGLTASGGASATEGRASLSLRQSPAKKSRLRA